MVGRRLRARPRARPRPPGSPRRARSADRRRRTGSRAPGAPSARRSSPSGSSRIAPSVVPCIRRSSSVTSRSCSCSVGQSTTRMSCSYSASVAPERMRAKYSACAIGIVKPTSPVRPTDSARALRLVVKLCARTWRSTDSRVSVATSGRPLMTRETVATETPACACDVADRRPGGLVVVLVHRQGAHPTAYRNRLRELQVNLLSDSAPCRRLSKTVCTVTSRF